MARVAPDSLSTAWQVVSVAVKVRDGPQRVADAYRILVGQEGGRQSRPAAPVGWAAAHGKEQSAAGRDRCPRLDGAAGTRADH